MRILSIMLLLGCVPTLSGQELYDFRGGRFDAELFRLEGPTPTDFVTQEAEGLRWRFVPGNRPPRTVGIVWRPPVQQGNFVATARYEILEVSRPATGFGLGPELYLILDTPGAVDASRRDGISYSRLVRPKEGPYITFSHLASNPEGKRYTKTFKGMETTEQSQRGRLRVAREGSTLIAFVAEGDAADFVEVHRSEIGPIAVRMIRFGAIAGGDPDSTLDMRLLEFGVAKGPTTVVEPAADVVDTQRPRPRHFWIVFALLLVPLVLTIVLWWRRRQSSERSDTTNGPIACTCAGCGTRLKAAANLTGKRVKCPQCGEAVPVSAPSDAGDAPP
jgi:transposase